MKIAIDVYYIADRAKTVGVIFKNWYDAEPLETVVSYTDSPLDYEPGNFYKRELPCIENLLKQVDLTKLDAIVVDGYVYLDNDKKPGLGYHVYKKYEEMIPVIGVAKNSFHNNVENVANVYRGESKKPLYITAVGVDLLEAAAWIESMHGPYRFPHMLKLLDTLTKTGWDGVDSRFAEDDYTS